MDLGNAPGHQATQADIGGGDQPTIVQARTDIAGAADGVATLVQAVADIADFFAQGLFVGALAGLEPHERSLARFLMGSDGERDSYLKLIPMAHEGSMLLRKMVNGTPAIVLGNGQMIPGYRPAPELAKIALEAK